MARALYRTYRPQKLSEVIGQEHITTALQRALEKGTVSHAYLFTGPRGVGKTSIARILAHEINGLPYEDDRQHLDIIEIDAASNRRIDEIRDLRDKVHIAPSVAKYKVYIIDEVHMLTKEAFNALLKTLEEPPAHVVFILATTEAHKLPETIISRTQRYAFKPVDLPKVADHLQTLATAEHIDIDRQALELIAAHGDGSFRDSISLLDQVRNTGDTITLTDVQNTLGIAPKELIEQLLHSVATHDAAAVVRDLHTLQVGGHDPAQVARQLGGALRAGLLDGKPLLPSGLLLQLLGTLIEVPASGNPRAHLEIALLDAALADAPLASTTSATPPAAKQVEQEKPHAAAKPTKVMSESIQIKPAVQIEPHPSTLRKVFKHPLPVEEEQTGPISTATLSDDAWPAILAATKARHNTLFSIVRTTRPHFEPGIVTLECGFAFHQKRLQEARNKQVMADIIKGVTGENLTIRCTLGQAQDPNNLPQSGLPPLPPEDGEIIHSVGGAPTAITTPATASTPTDPVVSTISNIFGGAEVLES
jgi:DNA polymerase-3 subunit gamma/tau